MSNRGLRGNGHIDYLGANIKSGDFLFLPDSMYSLNADFSIDHGIRDSTVDSNITYPDVQGDSVQVFWKPYQDSMIIQAVRKPIQMFNGDADMKGELEMSKLGLKGRGHLEWEDAGLSSEDMLFSGYGVRADTSRLQIKSIDEDKVALDLPNVMSNIHFGSKTGYFRSNHDSIPTELPFNLYRTSMDEFKWDMSDKTIDFKSHGGREYSTFQSVHKGQDSLNFKAKTATYDLNTYELTAFDVPYISVADSRVIPKEGTVVVGEGAKMKTLEGATVLIDSSRQQFKIRDASVDILGRLDMKGTGYLDYKNRSGKDQSILITELGVFNQSREDTIYTFAKGFVPDSQNFKLDPQIFFKGRVNLQSREDFINFDGLGKLQISDSGTVRSSWFKINDYIDPTDVQISARNVINAGNDSCYSGIHMQADSTNLYSTLMGSKKFYIDNSIFKAYGKLKYDEAAQEYIVADTGRLNGTSVQGNLFKYNNITGNVLAQGKTNLDMDLGAVSLKAMGTIEKKKLDSLYRFNMMMALDFYLSDDVLNVMYNDFVDITFSKPDIDVTSEKFKTQLAQYLGDDEAFGKMYEEYNKTGVLQLPKKLDPPTMILTDVQMVWDEYTGTYLGVCKAGLAWFNGKFIGKQMECYIELGYRRSEDYFNLYLIGDNDLWSFFNYQNKKLSTITSNVNVNSHVINTKIKDRRFSNDNGDMTFGISTEFSKDKFVQQMLYFDEYLHPKK